MKKNGLTFLFILIAAIANAQAPTIEWEKCFGGSSHDYGRDIIQTSDGGYIAVGSTLSNDYDAIGCHAFYNIFVVKLSANYITEWTKCLGGSHYDYASSILETSDQGFILVGSTASNDGDVSGNHGGFDGWVVKLDNSGEIEWQKCYGGTSYDDPHTIIATNDGGYICMGNSNSNDGDIVNPEGINKGWLLKIDSVGNIIWSQVYGGNIVTRFHDITPTSDGGYMIVGEKNLGALIWFLKVDEVGVVEWEMDYETTDDIIYGITQLSDGSYIAVGWTYDYQICPYEVGLILKISESGVLEWRRQGTYCWSQYYTVKVISDGSVVVGGDAKNVTNNYPDFLLIKMSQTGQVIWEQQYQETGRETLASFQQTTDQGFILVGSTTYPWTANHGGYDMWILKLSPEVGIVELDPTLQFQVSPNPTPNILNIQIDPALLDTPYKIYSTTGQLVQSGNLTAETMQLNIESFTEGIYILQIGNQTQKIVKVRR